MVCTFHKSSLHARTCVVERAPFWAVPITTHRRFLRGVSQTPRPHSAPNSLNRGWWTVVIPRQLALVAPIRAILPASVRQGFTEEDWSETVPVSHKTFYVNVPVLPIFNCAWFLKSLLGWKTSDVPLQFTRFHFQFASTFPVEVSIQYLQSPSRLAHTYHFAWILSFRLPRVD